MDLRDADFAADLPLAEAVEERKPKQSALSLVQHAEAARQGRAGLAELVARLDEALDFELASLPVHELRRPCPQSGIELLEAA